MRLPARPCPAHGFPNVNDRSCCHLIGARAMEAREFSAAAHGRYGQEYWAIHPKGGRVWIRPARMEDVPHLHGLTVSEIGPQVGPERAMRDVHLKNHDALWVVEHAPYKDAPPQIAGYYSFLPLSEAGLLGLKDGTLTRADQPLELIVPEGSRPAALYLWAVVA